MLSSAPRPVLETLHGVDGDRAMRLRDQLEEELPDEAASSLAGLDSAPAWEARRRLLERSPIGVLESLRGLERDSRTADFIERALARSEGRPRIVRKAVALHLAATAAVPSSSPRS
jgi:hypothetical protein